MTNVIVTGVDKSETALKAARKAGHVASAMQAELHIISAYGKYEAETFESGADKFFYSNETGAAETAQDVARQVQQDFPDLKITTAPAEGGPGEALVKVAEERNASLIVVGNRRVQGLGRVLGSIARDVAAHAPCDVYVAHTQEK